jgi:two-component system response regulator
VIAAGERPAVLLVDDSSDDLAIAMRALGRADLAVEIHVAHSGREALAVLRPLARPGSAAQPKVVFLDLRMPELDGFDVLQELRKDEHMRCIPVVVVSSADRPEDISRSYELGANSYLVKRFDPEEPGSELVAAARYWIELNRVGWPAQGAS